MSSSCLAWGKFSIDSFSYCITASFGTAERIFLFRTRNFLGKLVALEPAILAELAVGARDPVVTVLAMSFSPDCLVLVLQVPLLKVAILAELAVGTRHPVIAPDAMSHSKDCVFVLNTDRLTACIAGGFIE